MVAKTSRLRSRDREQFWREVVDGQPGSGMSVAAWCREHGVSASSFYVWRQRLTKRRAAHKARRSKLVPVEIIPSAMDASGVMLEIEWPSQVRVQVRSGCGLELLKQVLTMLNPDRREAEGC